MDAAVREAEEEIGLKRNREKEQFSSKENRFEKGESRNSWDTSCNVVKEGIGVLSMGCFD